MNNLYYYIPYFYLERNTTKNQIKNGGFYRLYGYDYVDGTHNIGFIAEEVNTVDPVLITKDDGVTPSNINWLALQTYMVKEMQNLHKRISVLENIINSQNPNP
jgi:hypothetical protein